MRAKAWLMMAALVGPCAFAQDTRPAFDFAVMERSIEDANRKLRAVHGEIDQTKFDPEEWLEQLDYDGGEILSALSEEIAFQPYSGVLRGVRGTLRSRAGNSVDQALLLAWLLKSAGFDARIAHGTLHDSDARRLLALVDREDSDEALDYLLPVIEREFGPRALESPRTIDWAESKLGKRAEKTSDILLKTLARADVHLRSQRVTEEYLAATRDYFWVQHRSGPAEEWIDAHPAFGSAESPADVEALEYFVDSIPAKYQHRLTVAAYIDQRIVDEIQTHALMKPFTGAVANLDGTAFSYRNHPNGLTLASAGDIGAAVGATTLLFPMLNEATAPGAMAFDLSGRVIDPIVLGSGAAGLFSTLAERMEEATANVADADDPKDLFVLDSMWLEFTFTAPSGAETRFRRYILAPAGDQPRDKTEMVWELITNHNYVLNAGHHPIEYLVDRYLEAGIASGDWYRALVHKFSHPDAGTLMPTGEVPRDFAPLAQFRIMDAHPHAPAGVVAFRSQPNLLGIRHGFRGAGVAFAGVDVISNTLAQIRSADGELSHDAEAALRRGVWDTAVEVVPIKSLSVDVLRRANPVDVLHDSQAQKIDLEVLMPGQADRLKMLDMPPSALVSMRDDLDKGFVIVTPQRMPTGAAMQAWWKVHPETGETLGMTADGYGQEIVEYMLDMTMTGVGLVQAIGGMAKCTEKTDMVEGLCCLVETHVNNIAGLGFGGIMGATLGTATSVTFSIVDLAVQQVTEEALGESQGLMPQAALNCDQLQTTDW